MVAVWKTSCSHVQLKSSRQFHAFVTLGSVEKVAVRVVTVVWVLLITEAEAGSHCCSTPPPTPSRGNSAGI